jgi:hypothetical protein
MWPVDWKAAREPNVNQESCPEPLHAPTLSDTEALLLEDLPLFFAMQAMPRWMATELQI